MTRSVPPEELQRPWLEEHDSCALIANVRKQGRPSHGNVKRTLEALGQMGHRTGEVLGEGDGCGLLTDIPRAIWAHTLRAYDHPAELVDDPHFFVMHLMIPQGTAPEVMHQITALAELCVLQVLLSQPGRVRPEMLGPYSTRARAAVLANRGLCARS